MSKKDVAVISNCDMFTEMHKCLKLLGLLQLTSSDKVDMYKDELEEATEQITGLKEKLAEQKEAQHRRSVMLDRNTLTSSPIHKKKNVVQGSVTESEVNRSCSGTGDFPSQKQSSDKKKMVQKKLDFSSVQQASQGVPPVESASIPETQVRSIQLYNIQLYICQYRKYISHMCKPFQELIDTEEETRVVSAALEIMKSECTDLYPRFIFYKVGLHCINPVCCAFLIRSCGPTDLHP